MRVAIVNGSPRAGGATAQVLREIAERFSQAHGAEVDYLDLARTPLRLCRGCIACYRTGACTIDDGLEDLARRVRQADAVVIGSPTHGSNVSAVLKNFLDRGHFLLERALLGKHSLAVATEEIADGSQVLRVLDKFFLVAGARRGGRFLVKLEFDGDPFAVPATRASLHRKVDRLATAIRAGRGRSVVERLFGWALVRIFLRPVLLRSPAKYAAILRSWEAKGILARQ